MKQWYGLKELGHIKKLTAFQVQCTRRLAVAAVGSAQKNSVSLFVSGLVQRFTESIRQVLAADEQYLAPKKNVDYFATAVKLTFMKSENTLSGYFSILRWADLECHLLANRFQCQKPLESITNQYYGAFDDEKNVLVLRPCRGENSDAIWAAKVLRVLKMSAREGGEMFVVTFLS